MKTDKVHVYAALLIVIVSSSAFAQEKYVPSPNEELYGTWVNSKEFNLNGFQKLVIAAGADSWYANVSDSAPRTQSVERIESKRTDSQGDIWYQLLHTTSGGLSKGEKLQMFVKLSKGSTVLELVYRGNLPDSESSRFPKAIDPNDVSYGIYYRAEK